MKSSASKLNNALTLMALCLGFFMVIIDVTVVNVALPSLAQQLHTQITGLQWVVDGYTLTFACLLLSAGHLADRVGAKASFLWGLSLFVITSLGCGLSTSVGLLIAFRLVQGLSAALIVPTSIALINASYDNQPARSRAIGIWAGVGGIAAASGPVLGGILTAGFGWQAVFYINIPVGIIAILLTLKYVAHAAQDNKGAFDLPGQVAGILSIAALAFALIEAGRLGWFSLPVLTGFGIFLICFLLFLAIEYRSKAPMLPLALFHSQTFSASIAIGMILNSASYGLLFILPLYFQQIRGFSVLLTGLAVTPFLACSSISSYFGGRVASVIGPRLPITIGLSTSAIGFLGMFFALKYSTHYFVLMIPLAMIGLGTSFTMPAATIAAISSTPEGRAGIAAGTFNASRQLGSLIGVAIFGTIISTVGHFMTGMYLCLLIGVVVFFSGSIIGKIFIKK
jgi:DHA2 family methylenomycin A resistance protein-like MFS transporter